MQPPTEIDFLRHYGLDRETTEILRAVYGDALLPVQESAILRHRLFDGGNMVISSPTSSGKTLVGEIACLRYACLDRASVFLVPTKALANEKYRHFRRAYGRRGFHVILSTRDQRRQDADLIRGRYHIAVVVYEKLKALLAAHPRLLRDAGLLVVDELQTVFDPQRGPNLEVLLTQIRRANPHLQVLGLSAVLGPGRIDEWLGAVIVEDRHRAAPLRQGVVCNGVFHYREYTTGERGEEPMVALEADPGGEPSEEDLILANALHLARRGEQTLVFLPRRDLTVRWAQKLAAASDLPPAEAALAEAADLEETTVRAILLETLQRGVAFHNSDLTWSERRVIERHTAAGGIRLLTSTNTLAEGVNLPVVNTFATRYSYRSGASLDGPPELAKITKAEFQNMTGRSGRFGQVHFGRGLLAAVYPADVKAMLARYVDGPFDELEPALFNMDLAHPVLHLVASGLRDAGSLAAFFAATLSGRTAPERVNHLDDYLEQVLARLEAAQLIRGGSQGWEVTDCGRAANQYALSADSVTACVRFLETFDRPFQPLEVFRFLAGLSEGAAHYVPFSRDQWRTDGVWRVWLRRTGREDDGDFPLERPPFEAVAALKKALLLEDWIGDEETRVLERRYGVLAGNLKKLGESFGFLLRALAEIATATGRPPDVHDELDLLARRLAAGCTETELPLAEIHAPAMTRSAVRALHRAGCRTGEELRTWTEAQLAGVLPLRTARDLFIWLHDLPEDGEAAPPPEPNTTDAADPPDIPEAELAAPAAPATPAAPVQARSGDPRLQVDADRPDIIRIDGIAVEVTTIEFQLAKVLSDHRGKVVAYERLMDLIWPDAVVQQQQIGTHKRHLAKKIKDSCGTEAAGLIRTVPRRGLILDD